MSSISDRYSPQEVETKIYDWWTEKGHFKAASQSDKPSFSVILPPPNVTGFLHIGHALNHSIQDALVRWKRMSGFNTLWLPGTDHAGIATQSIVEKELAQKNVTRQELGREKFLEEVWKWKEVYGQKIVNQMKRLGNSCDWDRSVFTLDEGVSAAVKKAFVDLHKKGWIYRGTRLINWSPKLQSALSNLEVDHKEVTGQLTHIKYPIDGTSEFLVVATTRPETFLGDSAVAVHPEDSRYTHLIGKQIVLPLCNRKIPVIADAAVDKEFGSGAVKITPAHDFNDYEMGIRHNLEMINILNKDGTLNENGAHYKGLSTHQARKKIVEDLEEQGLIEKIEKHKHSVGHCSRSGCVVEPYLSAQWFVAISNLAGPAKKVVEKKEIHFHPETWEKTYLHWMDIIEDWCISRQLWWGHRIPAWHCNSCNHVTVSEDTPSKCESCSSTDIYQEEDVLDTWFSSQLWPFTTMGWPEKTEELETFYPTTVLVTGHDIIFFWVARMIMSGLELPQQIPFKDVYIHGLVRDSKGVKMSKSLGNSIDPLEVIESHGADALRLTLLSQVAGGKDIKFSMQTLEGYRNFMNKVWNATRFSLTALEGFKDTDELNSEYLNLADHWITGQLRSCVEQVNKSMSQYRFNDAVKAVYSFVWNDFCDWYLEMIKPVVYGEDSPHKIATQKSLAETLNRMLKLLHPFAPFISEELYQKIPIKSEALIIAEFPTLKNQASWLNHFSEEQAHQGEICRGVIAAIRNIRGENRIKPGVKIKSFVCSDGSADTILKTNKDLIMNLAGLSECSIGEIQSYSKCAVSKINVNQSSLEIAIPLEGLVDFQEEIKRLNKTKEKTQKEFDSLSKRMSSENFLKNAPKDVVKQNKQQLTQLTDKLNSLTESLERLQ